MIGFMPAMLQDQPLVCKACNHEWLEPLINNVPIDVWVAHVKSLRCPECGAGSDRLAFHGWGIPAANEPHP